MATVIEGKTLERVRIADDSEDNRETLSDDLRDANFTAEPLDGPFLTLQDLLRAVTEGADAAVCDHHLAPRNYAPCTGAELLGRCYDLSFPSVLVTKREKSNIDQIRPFRSKIPSLIPTEDVNTDAIIKGWEVCIGEFNQKFIPARRSWSAVLRVDYVYTSGQQTEVDVILPAWNSDEIVKLSLEMFPENIREHVRPEERFFAKVNLGAENQFDLYFENIEYRGK
jgi:hypothetical protein